MGLVRAIAFLCNLADPLTRQDSVSWESCGRAPNDSLGYYNHPALLDELGQ